MTVELHLPDLPDVPVALGADPGAAPPRIGWRERLRQGLLNYLPLLLMVVLVLGSWWLVTLAPKGPGSTTQRVLRHEPDYALDRFEMQRWDATGQVRVRLEGQTLQHFPDTDELAIEALRVSLSAPDGRTTDAVARQAVVAADLSQARLEGDVTLVTRGGPQDTPVQISGQRFVLWVGPRRVSTDQPVKVTQGSSELTADGMDMDALTGELQLHGQVRLTLTPPKASK